MDLPIRGEIHNSNTTPKPKITTLNTISSSFENQKIIKALPKNKLSPTPLGMRISQVGTPWRTVKWIIGAVLLLYFIEQLIILVLFLVLEGEMIIGNIVLVFTIPFVFWFAKITRPKLLHMHLFTEDKDGSIIHALRDGTMILTPVSTRLDEHLVRNERPLDLPTTKILWAGFSLTILCGAIITLLWIIGMLGETEYSNSQGFVIIALIGILLAGPAWLAGFSLPVLAWVSVVTNRLRIIMVQREVTLLLILGMVSTLPAVIMNSLLFPWIVSIFTDVNEATLNFLTAVISAPIGEEIFKGVAVWTQRHRFKSQTHAFLIGFIIGLGFAILENLQYILFSLSGGPFTFTLTTLVRGIGSIPGHGLWTGLTAIGLSQIMFEKNINLQNQINKQQPEWVLLDIKTGFEIYGGSILIDEVRPLTEKVIPKWWPRTPIGGLLMAILGHSFWNATSSIVLLFSDQQLTLAIILSIFTTIILVAIVLRIGRNILKVLSFDLNRKNEGEKYGRNLHHDEWPK